MFFINEYECQIINDRGIIQIYPRHLFVTLEKHRDRKLEDIGI
jgi:hypothetical protein